MSRDWATVKLGEVAKLDLESVRVDPSATYNMVGVYSFGKGLFLKESVFGANTSYKVFYRLKPDHVVMSQLFGWEGALALSSEEYSGRFVSPQFPTFLCDPEKLERRFLGWLIRRPLFWKELGTKTKGMGDRRRTLNPDSLLTNEVPLPPLDEQRRIVRRIDELTAKIEEARGLRRESVREVSTVTEAQTSAMFDTLTTYPQVAIKLLGENGDNPIQIGPFGAQLHREEFVESGVPVLNVGNVTNNGLDVRRLDHVTPDKARFLARYTISTDDLLFARSGATLGKVCLVPQGCDDWLMTGHLFRVRFDAERCLPKFAYAALRGDRGVRTQVFGQVRGATRPGFNTTLLGQVKLPLPSVTEQRCIVDCLEKLQTKVDAIERLQMETAAELDALLPSVLDKAFKGHL